MSTVMEEIQTLLKNKSTDPVVLAKGVNGVSDTAWQKLSSKAQNWVNAALEELEVAQTQKRAAELPPLEGASEPASVKGNGHGEVIEMPQKAPVKAQTPIERIPLTPKSKKSKASVTPKPKAKAEPKPKTPRGINLKAAAKALPCREGTKQARLIELLSRVGGATFDELHAAMNAAEFKGKKWQPVTTRSALSWDVHAVKGYGINTEFFTVAQLKANQRKVSGKPDEVVAVYHLVLPKGMKAYVPHIQRASKPVKAAKPAAKSKPKKAA